MEFSKIEAPIKRQINALDVFHNSASLCLDLCLSGPGIEQCVSSPLYHGHHSPSCGQDVDRSPNTTKKLFNQNLAKSYILRDGPIDNWISFKSSELKGFPVAARRQSSPHWPFFITRPDCMYSL